MEIVGRMIMFWTKFPKCDMKTMWKFKTMDDIASIKLATSKIWPPEYEARVFPIDGADRLY
jgi:hypothetical protein